MTEERLKAELWEIQALLYIITAILLFKLFDSLYADIFGWFLMCLGVYGIVFSIIVKAIDRANPNMKDRSIFEEEEK